MKPGKPARFPITTSSAGHFNALHSGDASLGKLMDGLQARGLDRQTVWIVLGDHGEAFGQHEGNYGHAFHVYEENVHVPFLIAAPELVPSEIRTRQMVSLIDTAPPYSRWRACPCRRATRASRCSVGHCA
jgi:membrane-anchored protein YejM (alkaline phosphatase superfamily)